MKEREFSKKLKEIDLQIFKIVGKRHKELGLDLTPIQGSIIVAISENEEALCQKHLEQYVSCNKSTLSSILDTMEKNNLIKRISDTKDTRKKVIVLTDKAKNIVEKIKEDKELVEKRMISGIEERELDTFYNVLNKIKENLERL